MHGIDPEPLNLNKLGLQQGPKQYDQDQYRQERRASDKEQPNQEQQTSNQEQPSQEQHEPNLFDNVFNSIWPFSNPSEPKPRSNYRDRRNKGTKWSKEKISELVKNIHGSNVKWFLVSEETGHETIYSLYLIDEANTLKETNVSFTYVDVTGLTDNTFRL